MLITDRGSEFHNSMARQLAELWEVSNIAAIPKNPEEKRRTDKVENKQMRTIRDLLQGHIQKNETDGDEYRTQGHYTTVNEATGMTPYWLMMMYGCEMTLASEDDGVHASQASHSGLKTIFMKWCRW